MQGDILELEQVTQDLFHAMECSRPRVSQRAPAGPAPAQVAIYNEDDLSHLLYTHHTPAHTPTQETKTTVSHTSQHDYSLLLEHPSGTHTPASDNDNESAILSDCESEDDEYVLPPSPTRPRGGSIDSENIEFPVFLGRQAEPLTPPREHEAPAAPVVVQAPRPKHVRIVSPEHHMEEIGGPLMSWWPAPLETMEHEWTDVKVQKKAALRDHMYADATSYTHTKRAGAYAVPVEHQVADIEGPMMTWWPPLQYEWNDLFYE